MAWIDTTPSDNWADTATALAGTPGSNEIDAVMEIHALNPRGLAAHHAVYTSAMSGTATFRKVDRELVAFVVSQTNECHY